MRRFCKPQVVGSSPTGGYEKPEFMQVAEDPPVRARGERVRFDSGRWAHGKALRPGSRTRWDVIALLRHLRDRNRFSAFVGSEDHPQGL